MPFIDRENVNVIKWWFLWLATLRAASFLTKQELAVMHCGSTPIHL